MFRFVTSDPALVEAHARTERAMYELQAAIREAFEHYGELVHQLESFDGRLEAERAFLRGFGYLTGERPQSRERAASATPDRDRPVATRPRGGSTRGALPNLPAPSAP